MPQPDEDIRGPRWLSLRHRALVTLGWIRGIDLIMVGISASIWLAVVVTAFFSCTIAIMVALVAVFVSQLWMLMLVYRALMFILDVRGEIATIPNSAAHTMMSMSKAASQTP